MSALTEYKLKPEQIEHWRKVLCGIIGPYAMLMPDEQIQQIRDRMQYHIDNLPQSPEVE